MNVGGSSIRFSIIMKDAPRGWEVLSYVSLDHSDLFIDKRSRSLSLSLWLGGLHHNMKAINLREPKVNPHGGLGLGLVSYIAISKSFSLSFDP